MEGSLEMCNEISETTFVNDSITRSDHDNNSQQSSTPSSADLAKSTAVMILLYASIMLRYLR